MAYRRKIIDGRTRLGKAINRLIGFGILIFVLGALLSGHSGSDSPSGIAKDPAASMAPETSTPTTAGEASPEQKPPEVPGYADSGVSVQTPRSRASPSTAAVPGGDPATTRTSTPWRHVTSTGVRWSLRNIDPASMLLLIDLGGEQVANITVTSAFIKLDPAGISDRVDRLQAYITQQFTNRSARYSFDRDGTVKQLP